MGKIVSANAVAISTLTTTIKLKKLPQYCGSFFALVITYTYSGLLLFR